MVSIPHVIPTFGFVQIRLFPPADRIYAALKADGEVARLEGLMHLGALRDALPGVSHSRWDYTASMLYLAERLKGDGLNGQFRLGTTQFSSTNSALQCLALFWNLGHLPGTFAVEKGICRFAFSKNRGNPLEVLPWTSGPEATRVRTLASEVFEQRDYTLLPRLLALNKVLASSAWSELPMGSIVNDLLVPFVLRAARDANPQWGKLDRWFELVRRVAYLNLDVPFAGPSAQLDFLGIYGQVSDPSRLGTAETVGQLREAVAPVERMVFASLYHRPEARAAAASAAEATFDALTNSNAPEDLIRAWGRLSVLPPEISAVRTDTHVLAASALIRSHLVRQKKPSLTLEADLTRGSGMFPMMFVQPSWDSEDGALYPDELLVDLYGHDRPEVKHVGKMIAFVIDNFDQVAVASGDRFGLLATLDLQPTYRSLLSQAAAIQDPNVSLRVDPWPLRELGCFRDFQFDDLRGASVWPSGSKLDGSVVRHLARSRKVTPPESLRSLFAELRGVAELRDLLAARARRNGVEQKRWLVMTGSVKFRRRTMTNGQAREVTRAEFDGGLVCIGARSGKMTFFGLETKDGSENPEAALSRKLATLGWDYGVRSISSKSAFFAAPMEDLLIPVVPSVPVGAASSSEAGR